jgi:glycosyltransferase involved in cell wall biosynthesis
MALEITLFVIYLFLGPLLWILFSVGAASSRRRMVMFKKFNDPLPDPLPHVTIIIPAKDEGARISDCLNSALAQDYADFDVLAVDDRSTDDTGKVMDAIATANPKLKAVHIDNLPPGWTGKNNALYRAAQQATGSWLLFIDSDVMLQPSALSASLAIAAGRQFDLFSLCLRHETRGLAEEVLIPLASTAIGSAYMMGLSNSPSNSYFFANGQFMLFERKAYNDIGGHEAVKNQYNEDMILAKIMKQSGHRPRIAWGAHLGSVRMYDSLATIMRGWSRIFFGSSAGSPWRSFGVMLFIVIGCYPLFGAATWGAYRVFHPVGICNGYGWIIAAFAQWLIMTIQIGIIYRWMGNRGAYALLFPISAIFLLVILARAVWMCLTKKVHWRGTTYSHQIELAKP